MHVSRIGHDTCLWARDAALADDIRTRRANAVYLPDVLFPPSLRITADLADALRDAELVVAALPSHGTRDILRRAAPMIRRDAILVSATKGLERDTLLRMSEVASQELGRDVSVAVLSGPSFAAELARQLPTAVSVASRRCRESSSRCRPISGRRYFRLYGTSDVVGVEIGGALKNIIAIAAGVAEGLALGHNALAGLITRGLAEITRLACAAGAQRETLAGLSGLGDLVLTCTGTLSRNRHVGDRARARAFGRRRARRHEDGRGRGADDRCGPRARSNVMESSCRSRLRWPICLRGATTRERHSTS